MLTRGMRAILAVVVAAGIALAPRTIEAHHSFAAQFDVNKPVTLNGTITRMLWANPHAWLYIDVKGADGKVVNWACENNSLNSLFRAGWKKTDLPVGVAVTVKGFAARNGMPMLSIEKVTLPDGRELFSGSPTDGSTTKP